MRSLFLTMALCWAVFTCLAQPASAPNIYSESSDAGRRIDSLFSSYGPATPGAAVAVVQGGQVIFQKGYGMASLEHDIPITPQTVFNIASVSKQFTAFAAYLLASEGKISLDDDVRKYIPELPDYGHVIRVRHLLAHTSGLRDQAALYALAGNRTGDVSTTHQLMKLITAQKNLNFKPGTAFGYCNTGYTLLAVAVQRASGMSFSAYTNERIFKPLGMNNTWFCDNYEKVVRNKAESYERIDGEYFRKPLNSSNPGPSNLMTTVEDLTKWVLNFEQPVVGTRELIAAFDEVSYLDDGQKVVLRISAPGDSTFHAKGQNTWNYRGLRAVTHGGHAAAFRTFLGRFPDDRFSIIALSNDEHNERLGARWQIADFFLADKMKPDGSSPAPRPVAAPKAASFHEPIERFAGQYTSDELATTYSIVIRNGALVMTHQRLGDVELKRIGERTFSGYGPDTFSFEMTFQTNGKGDTSGFTLSNFGVKNIVFVRNR